VLVCAGVIHELLLGLSIGNSAAYAGWEKFEEAAADAAKCIQIKPDFVKGE
jgi:hypothetical protein